MSFRTQGITPNHSLLAQDSDVGDDEREWNEHQESREPGRAVCDDVNGLSLSVYRRSYMGISSVHTVFRTMFKLRPSLQMQLKNQLMAFQGDGRNLSPAWCAATTPSEFELRHATPMVDEETSIEAYFAYVHGIVPFLDEAEFREVWRRRERRDRAWYALLNMVLVLGSLSVGDSEKSSQIYYALAKMYIDLELLGTGCVDTLRALCLLGGLYLHLKNAPNMAYAIMGVATRIAIALGLHRQQTYPRSAQHEQMGAGRSQMRRLMWWSVFCLDTWGATTLGRPTLGRWDPDTMEVPSPAYLENPDPMARALDCARSFCVIATRVQHRFAQRSPITTGEIAAFDGQVTDWYRGLPRELANPEECPTRLISSQYIMQNRYFNLRLLLYRPVLLRFANARVPLDSLPVAERDAIQCCWQVASEAINTVATANYTIDRIWAWSAVWYMYQATIVLLLSILIDPGRSESEGWKASVEKAIQLFEYAKPWSSAAARSSQVVKGLLDMLTNVQSSTTGPSSGSFASAIPPVICPEYGSWDSIRHQLGLGVSTEQEWGWDVFNNQPETQVDLDWYANF